jgi:hypothetical protein
MKATFTILLLVVVATTQARAQVTGPPFCSLCFSSPP